MNIRNIERYLNAVVGEFRDECIEGYPNVYEAKRKLWKCAIVVWEIDPNPDDRIDELRDIALDYGIKPTDIATTIESARSKARPR